MEPMGTLKCPFGLKLSIAVPGHALNPFFDGGRDNGCNNKNMRELVAHLDLNHPHSSEEELLVGDIVEVQKVEERDSVMHKSSKHVRLSMEQYKQLDEFYRLNPTIDLKQKKKLANRLNLGIKQVDAWFRNRRSRSKQKSTEMECEHLKECLHKLKEENHRLQLQVEQLRTKNLQLLLQLHTHHYQRVVTAPTGQQASTSSATDIFTSPWPGSNPSKTSFPPNAL